MASNAPTSGDKTKAAWHCLNFIRTGYALHQKRKPDVPMFIGLNGVQGAGKTTLVNELFQELQKDGLETIVCSIDDFYLNHEDQVALAENHKDNPLVQHRGEPGTHDIPLLTSFLQDVRNSKSTRLPIYDKSLFSGSGDRLPPSKWVAINSPSSSPVRIVIVEGWCVGFRSLPDSAVLQKARDTTTKTLQHHNPQNLLFINEKLKEYDALTSYFDAFIHLHAEDTRWVYEWRLEQEEKLRKEKGTGMTDEQVRKFVDGYYPAYELYTQELRHGVFRGLGVQGIQLGLVVGKDRKVKEVHLTAPITNTLK